MLIFFGDKPTIEIITQLAETDLDKTQGALDKHLDGFTLSSYLAERIRRDFFAELLADYTEHVKRGFAGTMEEYIVPYCQNQLRYIDPFSRSTSVMSNLIEDTKHSIRLQVLRELKVV